MVSSRGWGEKMLEFRSRIEPQGGGWWQPARRVRRTETFLAILLLCSFLQDGGCHLLHMPRAPKRRERRNSGYTYNSINTPPHPPSDKPRISAPRDL